MSAASGETAPGLWQRYRRLSLGTRILIWMILGAVAGAVFGERAEVVAPLGELFIRLLLLAAVPLVFFNLLSGLTSLSDVRTVGRVGVRILAFYFSTMIVALILGLLSMHAFQPGVGMTLREEHSGPVGEVPRVIDVLMDMVPQNIFRAFVDAKVAQLVVFALLLGVAALMLPVERRQQLHRMFDTISVLLRQLVEIILRGSSCGWARWASPPSRR